MGQVFTYLYPTESTEIVTDIEAEQGGDTDEEELVQDETINEGEEEAEGEEGEEGEEEEEGEGDFDKVSSPESQKN